MNNMCNFIRKYYINNKILTDADSKYEENVIKDKKWK